MKLPQGTPLINLSASNAADQLVSALGLEKGDRITVMTSQFERVDGVNVTPPEKDEKFFNSLCTLTDVQLIGLGLQKWSETKKGTLWLFPFEWYAVIPEGFELTVIDGTTELFKAGVTDDDKRFGALAYGIVKQTTL